MTDDEMRQIKQHLEEIVSPLVGSVMAHTGLFRAMLPALATLDRQVRNRLVNELKKKRKLTGTLDAGAAQAYTEVFDQLISEIERRHKGSSIQH